MLLWSKGSTVSFRTLFIRVLAKEKTDPTLVVSTTYRLRRAMNSEGQRIKSFLRENALPDLGVDEWVENFVIAENQIGSWVGIAGLETYRGRGLLRSVAVDKQFRGQGIGRSLVESVEGNAKAGGISMLYLLTDDASAYFEKLGFQVVDRKDIDEVVKASVEFGQMCKTATAMHKRIG